MNTRALDLAISPLDAARRALLQRTTRSAWLTRVVARRDSRLAVLATTQMAVLFALAVRAPVALFFLGPVLLGVVHLAADVRYLVLHRAPPRSLLVASALLAVAITVVRGAVGLHLLRVPTGDELDVALGLAWIGIALALGLAGRVRAWPALAIVATFSAAGIFLVAHARMVGMALVHGHNLVAVLVWLVLFRRRTEAVVVPLLVLVMLAAVALSGGTLPWTFAHGGAFAFDTRVETLAAWLVPPGVRVAPHVGAALVVTFVFLQGVHYAAWTGWIAQDDLPGEGTPTFRMSVRSLVRDFGPVALSAIGLLALCFAFAAIHNLRQSVGWYMTLAKSHAWFECAFFTYFVVSGRRDRETKSSSHPMSGDPLVDVVAR